MKNHKICQEDERIRLEMEILQFALFIVEEKSERE